MTGSLGHGDLGRMSDLLAMGRAEPGVQGGMPPAVLAGLADLVRCDLVSFSDFDVACTTQYVDQEHDGQGVRTVGVRTDEVDPFWRHYWSSAFCSYPTRTGDARTVTTLSDFCSPREWRASPMYVEVFGGDGIEHELMCCLATQGTRSQRVLLCRAGGQDFDDRDRMVMALLRPHLADLHMQAASVTSTVLTPRQTELLRLVAAGLSTAQIAETLYLSPGTVRKHLENIFARLGVTSRTAAVMRVFAAG
jgi:DNA-binding CsgD family transcriptional regulator